MAIPTTYYNLLKPQVGETYDVNTLDTNYDKIDTAIHNAVSIAPLTDKQLVFVNAGYAWTGGGAWDAGVLSIDTGAPAVSQLSSPQPAFASAGSLSGSIKFLEAGIYDVQWYNAPGADPGNSGYSILMSGTWPGPPDTANTVLGKTNRAAGSFYWECMTHAIGIRVPSANLEIRLTGQQVNSTTNIPHVKVIQRSKF